MTVPWREPVEFPAMMTVTSAGWFDGRVILDARNNNISPERATAIWMERDAARRTASRYARDAPDLRMILDALDLWPSGDTGHGNGDDEQVRAGGSR